MEGRCQLTAKQAMSKCRQMQMKGVTMATPNRSPPLAPATLRFSVDIKYTFLYLPTHEGPPWTKRWVGVGHRQSLIITAKVHSNGTTTHAAANIRWPTADLPVNSDYWSSPFNFISFQNLSCLGVWLICKYGLYTGVYLTANKYHKSTIQSKQQPLFRMLHFPSKPV